MRVRAEKPHAKGKKKEREKKGKFAAPHSPHTGGRVKLTGTHGMNSTPPPKRCLKQRKAFYQLNVSPFVPETPETKFE